MPNEVTVVLTLFGVLGTWTATVAALVYWLSNKFASLERCMHKSMAEHIIHNDAVFHQMAIRIQRLELKEFGFTSSAANGDGIGGMEP